MDLVSLTVTSYLIFQGIAPCFCGPVSDVKGRRIAYCCTVLVFLGASVGLAQTKNYTMLMILRCLQSTGSASTIAIGSGVIGDITTRAERAGFVGIFQAGFFVSMAFGSSIGHLLADLLGWRSVFWFLSIYSGAFLALLVILLLETLRLIVANGGRTQSNKIAGYPLLVYQKATKVSWNSEADQPEPSARKRVDILGPFRILISKYTAPIIVFLAIYYAVWQMSIAALSSLFKERYSLSAVQIGRTFIVTVIGSTMGTQMTGTILYSKYRQIQAKHNIQSTQSDVETGHGLASSVTSSGDDFPLERARLRWVPTIAIAQCASILLFGWTVQYSKSVHIAVPMISTFVTSWTAVSTQTAITTYLIDVFPDRSASASASLNFARCLAAAGGTRYVIPMVNSIGVGLTFIICTVIQIIALSGIAVQCKFAGAWRREAEKQS